MYDLSDRIINCVINRRVTSMTKGKIIIIEAHGDDATVEYDNNDEYDDDFDYDDGSGDGDDNG